MDEREELKKINPEKIDQGEKLEGMPGGQELPGECTLVKFYLLTLPEFHPAGISGQ